MHCWEAAGAKEKLVELGLSQYGNCHGYKLRVGKD